MNQQHPTIESFIDYIHGELGPEEDAAFLLHLEGCEACRAQHETEARISEALRLHAKTTERELPIGVVNSIWDAIDVPAQPSFLERTRAWMRPAISLPLAAAAALVLYFGVVATHQTPAQVAIDAGYYLDDHAALTSTVPFGEGNAVPVQLENDQSTNGAQTVAVQTVLTIANVSR